MRTGRLSTVQVGKPRPPCTRSWGKPGFGRALLTPRPLPSAPLGWKFSPVTVRCPSRPALQCSGAPRRTHALEMSQLRSQASLPSSLGSLPPPPQPLLPQNEWGWLLPALGTSPSCHPAIGCQPPPWGLYHSVFQLPWGSWPAGRGQDASSLPVLHTLFFQGSPALLSSSRGRASQFPGGDPATLP